MKYVHARGESAPLGGAGGDINTILSVCWIIAIGIEDIAFDAVAA